MKRQRAKQRPLYRYDVYRGRRRGQARLSGAAGCAVFGLLLVLIRSLGIRLSGVLLLGRAARLVLSWLLDRLAAEGKAIIMISSELPEILGMCDRIYVMNEGKIVGELAGSEATQELIMSKI